MSPSARARRWSILPFVALIRAYQATLGPLMGGHCRYWPTCSHYGLDAYREHGAVRGTCLTLRRILRCHPFGGHGFDPVPPRRDGAQRTAPGGGQKIDERTDS